MGNFIQLASGGAYDFDQGVIMGPFEMAQDIAWPLSGLNRFVNHTTRPWDVAIHSVVVARVLEEMTGDRDIAAAGLIHEGHEAVIGDIPTPVAWEIGYEKVKRLKNEVQSAIYWRLKIPTNKQTETHHEVVKLADAAALHIEKQMFMVPEPQAWSYKVPPHDWALATWRQVRMALQQSQQLPSAQIFIAEYMRLVDEKDIKIVREGPPPEQQMA